MRATKIRFCSALFAGALVWGASMPATDLATVIAKPVSRTIDLPAEIQPYLSVSLHAKVAGFVERVLVDRGSVVKQGELLVATERAGAAVADRRSTVQGAGGRSRTGCRQWRSWQPRKARTTG